MHSVLSCLITDVIGPASIAEELAVTAADAYGFEGGMALREHVRAIEVVLDALGLENGARVLLSPLAPAAYGKALRSRGVLPVLADVNEEDACLNPESVGKSLSHGIEAIFVHAPMGRVPDMGAFYNQGVPVVADIGEALGAREAEGFLGHGAQFVILPMETDGIATTGGGTLVLARKKGDLAALKSKTARLNQDAFLPDLNASLGLVQWREYSQALEARSIVYKAFIQSLLKGRHRTLASPRDEGWRAVPYSFPVVLASGMNEARGYARKKGVETLPAFTGRLLEEYPEDGESCPKAQSLMMSTVLFPLYPTLGKKNVQLIMKVLSTLP